MRKPNVLVALLYFGLSSILNSSYILAEDSSLDIFRSPLIQKDDYFLPVLGRLTPTNDFLHRDLDAPSRTSLGCGVTNMHVQKGDAYAIDTELYNCSFRYEASLFDKVRFFVSTDVLRSKGGVFDSSIRHFHNMFSFPNGPRRQSNQNQFRAEGRLNNGDEFSIPSEDFVVRDPVVGVSFPLFDFDNTHFYYLESSLSIPTGIYQYSLDRPDIKISGVYYYDSPWGSLVFGLSAISHLDREQFGIKYDSYSYGVFSSGTITLTSSMALLLASSFRSQILSSIQRFPSHAWYVDTGVRFLIFKETILDIVLRENPSPGNATSDVSIFLQVSF